MKELAIGISSRAQRMGESAHAFCERFLRLGLGCVLVEGPADLLPAHTAALAAALRGTGAGIVGVQLRPPATPSGSEPRSLVSSDAAVRRSSVEELLEVGRQAGAVGCRRVIVAAGSASRGVLEAMSSGAASAILPPLRSSDAELGRLCECLHRLARELPQITWCLAPAEGAEELPRPQDFELVRSDLGRRAPRFWHDTGVAALRAQRDGVAQSAWLEHAAGHVAGVTISDSDGQRTGLPPGSGCADLQGLGDALIQTAPAVLGLSADVGDAACRHALEVAGRVLGGAAGSAPRC